MNIFHAFFIKIITIYFFQIFCCIFSNCIHQGLWVSNVNTIECIIFCPFSTLSFKFFVSIIEHFVITKNLNVIYIKSITHFIPPFLRFSLTYLFHCNHSQCIHLHKDYFLPNLLHFL